MYLKSKKHLENLNAHFKRKNEIVMDKVILFIVEGALDRQFFGNYFDELIGDNNRLQVIVTNGDILTEGCRDPKVLIEAQITKAMEEYKILREDIIRIVHICDIDGSYFDETKIFIDSNRNYYFNKNYIYDSIGKRIFFPDEYRKNQVLSSWQKKKNNQTQLQAISSVNGIAYNLYFVSLYLEHFLTGDCQHLSNFEKRTIVEDNLDYEIEYFIDLFERKKLSNDFNESWEKIVDSSTNFETKSNLNILINELI